MKFRPVFDRTIVRRVAEGSNSAPVNCSSSKASASPGCGPKSGRRIKVANSSALVTVLSFFCVTMFATTSVWGQSVSQCRVITRQVEAEIDRLDQMYFDEGKIQHVTSLQHQALSAAAKGNGRRCMKLARQALRVARR